MKMGSWRQQQRLQMALGGAHFPGGLLPALQDRGTSPNMSSMKQVPLHPAVWIDAPSWKQKEDTEKRGWVQELNKVLANRPPIAKLQNCFTEVSVAKTSSPQWPKSLCKATTEFEGFRRLSSLRVDRGQLKIDCLQMPLVRNSLVI